MSTFRSAGLLCLLVLASPEAGAQSIRNEGGESLRGRGILEAGALFLFADVHRCLPEPSLPAAQIFVSTDGGLSWEKRGPELPGSELEYALKGEDGVWIAGLHTAEGPGVDPFLLAPVAGALDWTVRPIVEGPSELQGMGRRAERDFFAWVRPVDVHGEAPRKPVSVYRSQDSGRTWRPVTAPGAASERSMKRFAQIATRSGAWRIADREDGGFDLQRRDAGGWRTVKSFPWKRCGARSEP